MIRDLLWGCVICGEVESLRMVDRVETCSACGAHYRRGDDARINVDVQGRGVETRTAAEWSRSLPPVSATGSAECLMRMAESDLPIWGYGAYLGRVERFGEFHFGQLTLTEDHLAFAPREPGAAFDWPLGQITAIQPSSTALQLKARGAAVVSIRFVNSSSRLWEERLQLALRKHYSTRHITDFQPRLSFR